eukprot:Phypoly_transcript_10842.p1 GENE.Phypoly_transcript_10842~~Phypoly_transcript_10842.p1  ORF type:complete len:361 (+),score=87.62 Phypoly_transcript_10842:132-1214(+)
MLSKKRKAALGEQKFGTKQETFGSKIIDYFKQIDFPKPTSQTTTPPNTTKSNSTHSDTSQTTNTTTSNTSTVHTNKKVKKSEQNAEKEKEKEKEKKAKSEKKAKKGALEVDHFNERTEVVNGIIVMNPYKNPVTLQIFVKFMKKYFSDNNQRVFVLGINPSRLGAGLTGIPFTDPKNIKEKMDIDFPGLETLFGKSRKEPSGEFIHNFITAYGGPAYFFSQFYITSLCPLGFTKDGANYNFYDSKELLDASMPFILSSLRTQLPCGGTKKVAICLGTGKLATVLHNINETHKFFEHILEVEHPRYIVQYKRSQINEYIEKYKRVFAQAWKLSELPPSAVPPPSLPLPSSDPLLPKEETDD